MKTAIIIGSGVAGIAASIRLSIAGYRVQVFESNAYAGGKLHAFGLGNYRFDGGPSLFTMPHYVDELFTLAGKHPKDYFDYQRTDTACHYFWEDGTVINAFADTQKFAEEVQQKLGVEQNVILDYFAHVKNIYDHSGKIFLEKSLHKPQTWLSKETLISLMKIKQFDLSKSMHRANKIRLGEQHLVQLFDRFATYNGSNPYKAPGILNVIPWLEHGFGTFFPKGGMEQIPQSLFKLAKELGVEFHFSQKVDEIIVKNNKAAGIKTGDQTHMTDIVVSNMDVLFTYRKLLPEAKAPERILNQERSSSALVFYWGIKKTFPQLDLHNIFFSNDYKAEFDAMFNDQTIGDDPTVYINVSSKIETKDAPEGCENWFVMVNAPNHDGQDWHGLVAKTRKAVIEKLNRILKTDISHLIEEEKVWSPPEIEADTMSYKGALYGNSSNSQMAAFLRHPNFSNSINNLYFCGGSVHPGGGIPLALLSAKITSEFVASNHK
jgi:phytoene desaturase